ncbi:c-type cytochrome [Roseibium aggregatum]|uniref:c-type cytochrome n=1 Tax=Roseibium aggregatum TaxID=187304 RepID=UPI00094B4B8B|nr:cytochrome c [Roseibium aggregatum]UFI05656.1 cytochrome c [Roseibium aggregatum]
MSRIFLTVSAILSVIVLGILFWGLVSGKEKPPAASGAALVSVQVPALEGDALAGETLFRENCGSCHGDNAAGRDGIAPPLVHKIYEPGHHADGAFLLAVSRGVRAHHWPFGDMPPVDGVSQEDVQKIVAYVRALQRANGIN